jgi:hypothetical protein
MYFDGSKLERTPWAESKQTQAGCNIKKGGEKL